MRSRNASGASRLTVRIAAVALAGFVALAVVLAASGCGESVTFGSDTDANNNFAANLRGSAGIAGNTTTTEEPPRETYEVRRGETLIFIADKLGVSLNDLVRINNIADPRLIFVGQRLIVPPPPEEAERPARTVAPPTNPVLPSVLPTLPPTTTTSLDQ